MPNKFPFADEAGCFTFNRTPNVSRYFILCTVAMDDCSIASDLLDLRRKLAWEGAELGDYFHATEDRQLVRDAVFDTITKRPFTIQATILEKSKAHPRIIDSASKFYQRGWFYHFKFGLSRELNQDHETLITTACIGTKRERAAFKNAVDDVAKLTLSHQKWATDFSPAGSDPCLQVADYCAWAIQRKYERQCSRSYDIIRDRITYEHDFWQNSTVHYY